MARLQEALGVPLLSIQGRKAVLTAHGETLLRRARPLLQDLTTLEDLAHSLQRGWESQLQLVVDVAFPRERLLKIVSELGAACPQTQLQLADAVLSGAEDAITGQTADVVITSRVPAATSVTICWMWRSLRSPIRRMPCSGCNVHCRRPI